MDLSQLLAPLPQGSLKPLKLTGGRTAQGNYASILWEPACRVLSENGGLRCKALQLTKIFRHSLYDLCLYSCFRLCKSRGVSAWLLSAQG